MISGFNIKCSYVLSIFLSLSSKFYEYDFLAWGDIRRYARQNWCLCSLCKQHVVHQQYTRGSYVIYNFSPYWCKMIHIYTWYVTLLAQIGFDETITYSVSTATNSHPQVMRIAWTQHLKEISDICTKDSLAELQFVGFPSCMKHVTY